MNRFLPITTIIMLLSADAFAARSGIIRRLINKSGENITKRLPTEILPPVPPRASKKSVGRIIAASALGATLLTAPLQNAVAQAKAEDELVAVDENSPPEHHGAMLLRVSVPPTGGGGAGKEGADEGREFAFPVAFIGDNADGNALFVARLRQSGVFIDESLTEASEVALHAWDGVVGRDLTVTSIGTFADTTDGITFSVVLLEAEGLSLMGEYTRLMLDDSFPYDDIRPVEILAYRLVYSPHLREEELLAEAYTLRSLQCDTRPQQVLALIGNGFTTCGVVDKSFANGSLILHNGLVVALQSLASPTLLNENGDPLVWLGSEIPTSAVDYSMQVGNEKPSAVSADGKITTTWGKIKQGK